YRKDRRGKEFPKCAFWLAQMQKSSGNYIDARRTWSMVSRKYRRKNRDSYFYKKAQKEQKACGKASKWINRNPDHEIKNIGHSVNTTASEFGTHLTKDSTLIFSSLRADTITNELAVKDENYTIDIYKAEMKGEKWIDKGKLDSVINKKNGNNANASLSPKGDKLYFNRCNEKKDSCRIVVTKKKENGKWGKPKPLNSKINKPNAKNTHPYVTTFNGKEVLFFASNREGGIGKFDIWYSFKGKEGFKEPINIGKPVNSIDNEITPFYAPDLKILYFSSDWHLGLGGYDIFKARGEPDSLEKTDNLGVGFNSPANDLYFSLAPNCKGGFLTSNRDTALTDKGGNCCNDIFQFKYDCPVPTDTLRLAKKKEKRSKDTLPEYQTLEDLNKFLPVTLYFHNDIPNPDSWKTSTDSTYIQTYNNYRTLIPRYKKRYSKGLKGDKIDTAKKK
ncbi:MAG: hypothetical protein ABEH43_07555, partial [Flavobacteriales bacterium]